MKKSRLPDLVQPWRRNQKLCLKKITFWSKSTAERRSKLVSKANQHDLKQPSSSKIKSYDLGSKSNRRGTKGDFFCIQEIFKDCNFSFQVINKFDSINFRTSLLFFFVYCIISTLWLFKFFFLIKGYLKFGSINSWDICVLILLCFLDIHASFVIIIIV